MRNPVNRLELALVLLTSVALLVSGCSGMLALLAYAAAASEIASIFDNSGDNPSYTLFGTVYVDRVDNRIAISGDQTHPAPPGNWEAYPHAIVAIDTTPPRSTTTNDAGYFIFSNIPDTRLVLTVLDPNESLVSFNVRLDASLIEPAG